jgi:hypothetical protein
MNSDHVHRANKQSELSHIKKKEINLALFERKPVEKVSLFFRGIVKAGFSSSKVRGSKELAERSIRDWMSKYASVEGYKEGVEELLQVRSTCRESIPDSV